MPTKRERLEAFVILSGIVILVGGVVEALAEVFFATGWFHTIAALIFASSAVLAVVGMALSYISLARADWQESKNTSEFVALGRDDHIIAVHRIDDAIVHLPVVGTTHQIILAPNNKNMPLVGRETLEHIHMASQLPTKVEVMDPELYQKLFGMDK